MNLQELSLLKSFLKIKIDKLSKSKEPVNSNEYSELNLSKLMLKFIESKVNSEIDSCVKYTEVHSTVNKNYNYYTTEEIPPSPVVNGRICNQCKAKNPTHTTCICALTY